MIELVEFSEDEISTLQNYIDVHVHHTILQKTYVLTDNPIDKAINFITIYRILISCYNYSSKDDVLKGKLKRLLDEAEEVYNLIYPLVLAHENLPSETGKYRFSLSIRDVICNFDNNVKISKIVDAFLVFGEKIELNRIDDYVGVDLENDYGQQSIKGIRKVIEDTGI